MPTTKTSPKQQAYLFFLRHAGYSYDPKTPKSGRSRCARQLAKAERDAKALGYRFEWTDDYAGCVGCSCDNPDCKCSTGEGHKTEACFMWDPEGKDVVASLSGICEADSDYRRVVEAELATEALANA